MSQDKQPAARVLKLMREFEAAVRDHERAPGDARPGNSAEQRYEKAKERLARKIGQLVHDAAKGKELTTKLDDMHDYKDRSPL